MTSAHVASTADNLGQPTHVSAQAADLVARRTREDAPPPTPPRSNSRYSLRPRPTRSSVPHPAIVVAPPFFTINTTRSGKTTRSSNTVRSGIATASSPPKITALGRLWSHGRIVKRTRQDAREFAKDTWDRCSKGENRADLLVLWSDASVFGIGPRSTAGAGVAFNNPFRTAVVEEAHYLRGIHDCNIAELYAIRLALNVAISHTPPGRPSQASPQSVDSHANNIVAVFTDSTNCLDKINGFAARKRDIANDLAGAICEATKALHSKGYTTEFHWVPGHAGVGGNELVDHLARVGVAYGLEHGRKFAHKEPVCAIKVPQDAKNLSVRVNELEALSSMWAEDPASPDYYVFAQAPGECERVLNIDFINLEDPRDLLDIVLEKLEEYWAANSQTS